ncbi:hypothetical protein EJ05DRAFT_512420 [Pseudovirgaria hyperparasitica]|uniref:Fungal N-terminal domain-containing protein n=1 Tax=Pseudovirgaria hyperparasitica TaxID=470096 RepID=A0A6A6VYT6_9PEZI|nr:uncharacterized protein EJ05DRAFT_512420 [Pseudovirgaria hyperparasitica]KAF2755828.1 hypothetical protein EJ05DRAFT_512420 [Pseudovirgaria hyperparasitica]
MSSLPSVGDILMLSQLAWRIGRAFVAGSEAAPQGFIEIEKQVSHLSKSLKFFAEALFSNPDNNILNYASADTKDGVRKLLSSIQQTLQDLDSLIFEHQSTVKKSTEGGWTVVRTWSPMVLANYKYMMWTSEGGSLESLRDLLQMHTNTLKLTTHAVQSNSLSNLEEAVRSISEKVRRRHRESATDFDERIHEVSRSIHAAVNGLPNTSMDNSEIDSASPCFPAELEDLLPPPPPLKSSRRGLSAPTAGQSELQASSVGDLSAPSRPSSHTSGSSSGKFDPRWSALSGMNSRPLSLSRASMGRETSIRSQMSYQSGDFPCAMGSMSPVEPTPPHLMATDRHSSIVSIEPLPPSMVMEIDSHSSLNRRMDTLPVSQPRISTKSIRLANAVATERQMDNFQADAFKNSAILCDVRGTAVEWTRSVPIDPEEYNPSNPYGVELVQAMESCRLCIVKKREVLPQGETHIATSIWAFSDDGAMRMQQKLQDHTQYIPYSSYFSSEKISLSVPSELKFHDVVYGSRPLQVSSTNWINYVIEDAQAAASFQNELMSSTLIAQFKTEKTLRLHEGITSVLTYQEQMCGMENLRVWEDEVTKGIFAMIHFSAQFRPGYFAFWLNSSQNSIRVKDDGGCQVKVKGLRIPHGIDVKGKGKASDTLPEPNQTANGGRRGSEHKRFVTGARIEFSSEVEKYAFLDLVKQVQQTMIMLPDLM